MEVMDEEMLPVESDEHDFDENIVEEWINKFDEGTLTTANLKKHWRNWVPKIYSPVIDESCLNLQFDEELAQKVLFRPLEEFICKGDPKVVLINLSEMYKPSTVCGKVFKMGEPTYSCRECGMDNTCVLCVDCFKKSEHRFHKYKMGTSSGGGCCDCGDIEAWKKAPFCDVHIAATKDGTNPVTNQDLPQDLQERAYIVFEAVLWYAYQLLSTAQISDIRVGDIIDNFFDDDTYCTILYNDEVHTFEQVIGTLTRVLKCNQKTAIEFVTNIDREGRTVVKCSSFIHCSELKLEIEKYTSRHGNKPLKVLVHHAHIIAHQIFAMKLLSWLQNFLGHGATFRALFAKAALEPQSSEPCIIKGILLRDSSLWKSARTQWQRILISGMLLEYDNKKQLAKIFTRNYGPVMKDFIKDDHEHTFSISSLSVQLFTVPTLSHHLIAYDDVLYILLNTFMSECSGKCNKDGKLEFERSPASQTFKRAHFMLYDLKYLLSAIPEDWNDDLRKNFLHGLFVLFTLFSKMQGMDAVTRQLGQHMEYEPEWESAFNLHIRLAHCISLAIKWCGQDRIVLIKAYRTLLKKLEGSGAREPLSPIEIADHCVSCIMYDVSTRPVSIHLPLSRFLAGLHLHLEKFNLTFNDIRSGNLSPVEIMEPVLRAQVMIAQVHSGMWRRNGYSLLNQIYFYHNVKCRTEMLDRDITLLQMCASLIESNEFLIHVLHKFNLINWCSKDYETTSSRASEEDSMRQTISVVEELLQLLIVMIGERHMPGISNINTEDRIRKEIIQHLCVKPMSHSEINKVIADDVSNESPFDHIIDELAIFKKPAQGSGKGVYELKDQYFDEYNVFFYHYTKEELSKSEEAQRKRRKTAGELECCPPPKLLKLNESFHMLVNLLQCDVMLHVIQTVLERCNNLRARSFSELQLHKVLHLIGYALQEEESKNYPFFKFTQNSSKFKIFNLLVDLLDCPRVDAHKGLLKWILKKYKDVANQKDSEASCSSENSGEISKPLVDVEKERRAKLAAERRAKVMAQMQTLQKNFIEENKELFEESNIETNTNQPGDLEMDTSESGELQMIALGARQTTRIGHEKTFICILCQEMAKVTKDGPCLVLSAFVQQSTVLCQHKNVEDPNHMHDPLYLHSNLGPAPHTSTCGHVMHSDCWRKYYDNVMAREHRRPYRLRHPASFDIEKQEFLCPLCECLSNTALPLLPSLSILQPSYAKDFISYDDFLSCIGMILKHKARVCHGKIKCNLAQCPNLHCNACLKASSASKIDNDSAEMCEADCILQPYQIFSTCNFRDIETDLGEVYPIFKALFPEEHPVLNDNIQEMMQLYAQVTYIKGLNVNPHPSDKRIAPITWKSLSYTTHAIEVLLRDSDKPLLGQLSSRHRDCIENLVRLNGVLGTTWKNRAVIHSHALNLLSLLFEHTDDGPSVLHWDSLGILIPLTFALPSLANKDSPTPVPTGGSLDLHLLRTVFVSHIVKILVLLDLKNLSDSMDTDSFSEDDEILHVLKFLNKNTNGISPQSVWKQVQDACIPFLRCCCLFYHYLTDVPAPSLLCQVGGDTFSNMCTYLDLPQSSKELFYSDKIIGLVKKWCEHEEVVAYLRGTRETVRVVHEPLPIPRLTALPNDYSELINMVSTFTCPNNDEDSRTPSICLVCGKVLCSQSYCCQMELNNTHVGACNYHAYECGAGVGIFLRVRECEILFLSTPLRGCFVSPPYLDDYGETDMGLRRGNPLKLCEERYKKLQTLWLSHSIHEEIARAIESNSQVITTQWHHL